MIHLHIHGTFTVPDQGCCYFWAAEAVYGDWDVLWWGSTTNQRWMVQQTLKTLDISYR